MQERPTATAWEVIRLVQDVTVASDRYVDTVARREGTHRTDLHALTAVTRHRDAGSPLTPSELSATLGLSAPATSALLDRLQANGHVARERDATDRRRMVLTATEHARETGARMFMPLGRALGRVASQYTEEELALIARFLDEAATAISEAGEAPRDPKAGAR